MTLRPAASAGRLAGHVGGIHGCGAGGSALPILSPDGPLGVGPGALGGPAADTLAGPAAVSGPAESGGFGVEMRWDTEIASDEALLPTGSGTATA